MIHGYLKTPRLILRDYRLEDREAVHGYAADPEFSQYEVWGPNSTEDTRQFVDKMVEQAATANRYEYDFAICLRDEGELIGGCGIRRESELSVVASLGWAVNPKFQRNGFATEAARALIEFGFNELGLAVIYATCDARNSSSCRVMEKLGMRRSGFKSPRMQKGHLREVLRYELLNNSSRCT